MILYHALVTIVMRASSLETVSLDINQQTNPVKRLLPPYLKSKIFSRIILEILLLSEP
jgi:hypothetical protein